MSVGVATPWDKGVKVVVVAGVSVSGGGFGRRTGQRNWNWNIERERRSVNRRMDKVEVLMWNF